MKGGKNSGRIGWWGTYKKGRVLEELVSESKLWGEVNNLVISFFP